ncbi:O-antigen ligase domain-containing protein [Sinirhodobacter populi]|uniref:O-antigen ligase domain-containing protein n=1 Tax=Paenirhodobacter populi TaxID=2306993 RepID=A0A443KAH7_9RHOB|nr:O-antigen ligase family protein [Sinirhodobacter populi]RWR29831.1 O-antigen ligase domain-containing protein [Sinirhodobacter populi]
MPNLLAQIVLFSWPLVTWFLFRRLNLTQALAATVLLGYLFIPQRVGFDPPLLPPIDKQTMPSLCAAVALWLTERNAAQRARRDARLGKIPATGEDKPDRRKPAGRARINRIVPMIIGMLMLSSVLTWATNQSALFYGPRYIGGLKPYDIGSMAIEIFMQVLPFLMARKYLGTREAQTDLLKVLVYCGFAYSFLILWEARMSPQLNVQLYGFFAHSWIQHVRGGAFRPIVFLAHGLLVGIFLAMTILAVAVLARNNVDGKRKQWLMLCGWLVLCLVLSRNMGATIIILGLVPLILLAPMRLQFLVAAIISGIVLIYPMARGSGLIPTERIVSVIQGINEDRAQSLEFRLNMEDILLEKANERPLSGWGGWGRNRVYNPETGKDESITDGSWIMVIGVYGWVGYLGYFGLICLPAILSFLRFRRYGLDTMDAGFLLILAGNLIDLIPNASMVPVLWLIAGCTWGRLETGAAMIAKKRSGRPDPIRRTERPAPRRAEPGRDHSLNVTSSKT